MAGDNTANQPVADNESTNNGLLETVNTIRLAQCQPSISGRRLIGDSFQPGVPNTPATPPVEIVNDAKLTREAPNNPNSHIKDANYQKHKFQLHYSWDAKGNLTGVTSTFKDAHDRPLQPARVFAKEGNNWFFHSAHGKMPTRGEFRVDNQTGRFTQVLRKDLDKHADGTDGILKETTRTLDLDGTDTVNRMDGSSSALKFNLQDKATEWIEKDNQGKVLTFARDTSNDKTGMQAWKGSNNEIRYNPKIQQDGNLTYIKAADLGKNITQVITGTGEHIASGENGVRYTFNDRGDIDTIQFPKPRSFEGHIVDRIHLSYRNTNDNQGQIIDRLDLYNTTKSRSAFLSVQRVGATDKNNSDEAKNEWNTFDARGKQLLYRGADGKSHPYNLIGDYAIYNGLISTTEKLPEKKEDLDKLAIANPNIKKMLDAFATAKQPAPEYIICTYTNSPSTSTTSKPLDEEYRINPTGGADPLNILVPGEKSFKAFLPGEAPPPPPPGSLSKSVKTNEVQQPPIPGRVPVLPPPPLINPPKAIPTPKAAAEAPPTNSAPVAKPEAVPAAGTQPQPMSQKEAARKAFDEEPLPPEADEISIPIPGSVPKNNTVAPQPEAPAAPANNVPAPNIRPKIRSAFKPPTTVIAKTTAPIPNKVSATIREHVERT